MSKIACKNCRYFNVNMISTTSNFGDNRSRCQKNAPRQLPESVNDWAWVYEGDWCGDFEEKKENKS